MIEPLKRLRKEAVMDVTMSVNWEKFLTDECKLMTSCVTTIPTLVCFLLDAFIYFIQIARNCIPIVFYHFTGKTWVFPECAPLRDVGFILFIFNSILGDGCCDLHIQPFSSYLAS